MKTHTKHLILPVALVAALIFWSDGFRLDSDLDVPTETMTTIGAAESARVHLLTSIGARQTELLRSQPSTDSLRRQRADLRNQLDRFAEIDVIEPAGDLVTRCRTHPVHCSRLILLDDKLILRLTRERRQASQLVTDLEGLANLYEQEVQARKDLEIWYRRRENRRKWRRRTLTVAAVVVAAVIISES